MIIVNGLQIIQLEVVKMQLLGEARGGQPGGDGRLLGRLTPNSVEASQTVCDLNARDLNPGVRIQPGDQVTLADSSSGQ